MKMVAVLQRAEWCFGRKKGMKPSLICNMVRERSKKGESGRTLFDLQSPARRKDERKAMNDLEAES